MDINFTLRCTVNVFRVNKTFIITDFELQNETYRSLKQYDSKTHLKKSILIIKHNFFKNIH